MYIAGLHAGADWLRKKHPWHWKHTCPHIHTVTHIQMWGSMGGVPRENCDFSDLQVCILRCLKVIKN